MPSSTSQKFESLTKVETYPGIVSDDEKIEIDLKGHTIEELAHLANVSVDVIKSAINLRQQQIKIESKLKGPNAFHKEKKSILPSSSVETTKPWISTTTTIFSTTTDKTTQSTTSKSPYIPKKKIKKHPLHSGHKVNI